MIIGQEEGECVSKYEQHQQKHLFFFVLVASRHLIGVFYRGITDNTVQSCGRKQSHKHVDYEHQLQAGACEWLPYLGSGHHSQKYHNRGNGHIGQPVWQTESQNQDEHQNSDNRPKNFKCHMLPPIFPSSSAPAAFVKY